MLSISGDSYSAVGYAKFGDEPRPKPSRPLGVDYPGRTYTEPSTPNWVGHLVRKYRPHKNTVAYCYAAGGATVSDVKAQIDLSFLPIIGKKPRWAKWTETNSLFGWLPSLKPGIVHIIYRCPTCSNLGWHQ